MSRRRIGQERLFAEIANQLKARAIKGNIGTLVNATIMVSASEQDAEGHCVKHRGKYAVRGFKANVGAVADTALFEEVAITPANVTTTGRVRRHYPVILEGLCRQRLLGTALLRSCPCTGRHAAHHRDRHVRTAASRKTVATQCLEPASSSVAWSDPIDLRHAGRCYGLRILCWRVLANAFIQVRLTAIACNLKRTLSIVHRGCGVIAAGTMESAVSEILSKRMIKKTQMLWKRRTLQPFVRVAVLNKTLYSSFRGLRFPNRQYQSASANRSVINPTTAHGLLLHRHLR